jgi:hypothetical protein
MGFAGSKVCPCDFGFRACTYGSWSTYGRTECDDKVK